MTAAMPTFCDVALPVPLDSAFTYRVNGEVPVVGGRVLVPFREQRLAGVVVALHDTEPSVATKPVLQVLDTVPVLDADLIRLGEWVSQYYLAPLGEVFRSMLPLSAEVQRAHGYRITERGMEALHQSAEIGSSLRSRKSADEQMPEYSVLDYLLDGELVREATLRSATGARRELLTTLVRRKWIAREDISSVRDARRTVRVAVLKEGASPNNGVGANAMATSGRKLNANQQTILDTLRSAGGRARLKDLSELSVPASTLQTLVRRGLVEIVEEPADFHVSSLKPRRTLDFIFTPAQKKALDRIYAAAAVRKFSVTLLHGVTGSGKTAVYLAAMQRVLAEGRSAILLVPEIGLTPAAAAHLHLVFGEEVAILHSALTQDERTEQWRRIHRGEARMVVGTRSAVFAPVQDLALLVVDEEHDNSYKQEETPRYHARDVAVMRAKQCGAAVVLGSATPSLESRYNAQQGKYALVEIPDRVERRPLPEVEVVDMRAEFQATGHEPVIAHRLAEEIQQRLDRKEQSLVLLNRRGFSAFVLCRSCGDTIECRNCAIALTHHKLDRRLLCHYCSYSQKVPQTCPKCGSEYVQFLGTGSEKLEELLRGQFPQARIARLDRDTVRSREDFERVLSALHGGELDIVVGTQMIAKGHDIHGVTLVGVVGADTGLSMPDFRAAERTFQLITQVAGRAGRGEIPGKVVVQTYFPDHYAVQFAARHDYSGFYEKELRYRNWMRYPPFSVLSNVLIRSDKLNDTLKYTGLIGKFFEQAPKEGVRVLGPAVAPLSRLKGEHRYHFVLKSSSRSRMNALLRLMTAFAAEHKIPRLHLVVDVDALSLL
ncbi:MAG: primosomal protein N' [Candidatus Korobacteraceae bacterium]